MKFWFTSDYHFGHENIIEYCNRPFKDVEEMNNTIIENHNSRVSPEDTVFFLGDFCFHNGPSGKEGEGTQTKSQSYLDKLNGKMIMIKGNHDKNNTVRTCINNMVISLGGNKMFLVHNPKDYNKNYKINLVGHVHEKWKIKKINDVILVNVGVDVWDFRPIEIQDILNEINKFESSNNKHKGL